MKQKVKPHGETRQFSNCPTKNFSPIDWSVWNFPCSQYTLALRIGDGEIEAVLSFSLHPKGFTYELLPSSCR